VDNLRRSGDVVALVVRGDCTNQAFFNKDAAVLSLGGVAVLQSYQLRPARWLATRHVDEEEQPLKERVHLVKVRLRRLLLPVKLRFRAHSKHLVSQPIVLKYSIKQPSLAALLKLVRVAVVLKEVPAFFFVVVVVLEAIQSDLRYYIVASFIRMEEKQAL
jgi:hypothetical protein